MNEELVNNDIIDSFKLTTVKMRNSEYQRTSTPFIIPENSEWTMKFLSVLINELHDFSIDSNNGYRQRQHSNNETYYYMKIISNANVECYIMINIDWNTENTAESWVQKSYIANISNSGSRALLRNSFLVFYPQEDFNQIFHHFAASYATDKNSKNNADTCQIFSYYDNFIKHEEYQSIGFKELQQTCEDYLHLELVTNNNTGRTLDKIKMKPILISFSSVISSQDCS